MESAHADKESSSESSPSPNDPKSDEGHWEDCETDISSPQTIPMDIDDPNNDIGEEIPAEEDNYDEDDASDADEPLTMQIKSQLQNCLSKVHSLGSFASFGTYSEAVNPGIFIHGKGRIGLPLSDRDAQAISDISHAAPFGRGSETVVDSAIRKTLELNADHFELQNPKWNKTVEGILSKVAKELGLPRESTIGALPYKMLLYGKGAMFKPHRDSEKDPQMFATLVICLPSQHEGGEVHITHGMKKKIFKTAESSDFDYSYLCWYADVEHEVTEITAGYRFVLTYNLVYQGSGIPMLATHIGREKVELEETFALWRAGYDGSKDGCPEMLAYVFEHRYPSATLKYKRLKGNDRLRGEYLKEMCEKYGFIFGLASLEKGIEGDCVGQCYGDDGDAWRELYYAKEQEPKIHAIDEVREEWIKLRVVVDQGGIEIASDVPFDEHRIVQTDPFADDPDFEDWSGPTGNEGVSTTHYYRKTVAVLMLEECKNDFVYDSIVASNKDLSDWVRQLIRTSNAGEKDDCEELARICGRVIAGTKACLLGNQFFYRRTSFSDELLGVVLEAGMELNDSALCDKALGAILNELPQPQTVKTIQHFGLPKMQSSVAHAIRRFPDVERRVELLNGIHDQYKDLTPDPAILFWIKEETEKSFLDGNLGHRNGAKTILEAGRRYGDDFIIECILPAMGRNIPKMGKGSRVEYTVNFLTCVFNAWTTGQFILSTTITIFSAVLDSFIPDFTLGNVESTERRRICYPYLASMTFQPKELIELLRQCRALGLQGYCDRILDQLEKIALSDTDPAPVFANFLLPFANRMYDIQQPSPDSSNQRTKFTENILTAYQDQCVGSKPSPPADWTRRKCGCGCVDCDLLDTFLVNPNSVETWIPIVEDRVEHLRTRIPLINGQREHETHVLTGDSICGLSIRKTDPAWSSSVERWEEDQKGARRVLENNFNEGRLKEVLGTRFNEFLGGPSKGLGKGW